MFLLLRKEAFFEVLLETRQFEELLFSHFLKLLNHLKLTRFRVLGWIEELWRGNVERGFFFLRQ